VGWAIYRGKKEIIKRVVEKTSREVVWYGEGGGVLVWRMFYVWMYCMYS